MSKIVCTDLAKMRKWVCQELGQQLNILPADRAGDLSSNLWLPLVVTARGTLYGEVIAQIGANSKDLNSYVQPLHLTDALRQPLYGLGRKLLDLIAATPGVYLLQFGLSPTNQICFDRLIPFPDLPAIATLATQTPNLFECHWRCLSGLPIADLKVKTANYFVLDGAGSIVPGTVLADC